MNLAAAHPNSPSLWTIAEEMLALMTMALGGPGVIAAIERLTRGVKREILDWLAPLELMVRKLLLVEAAKLPRFAEKRITPRALTLAMVRSWAKRKKPRFMPVEPNRPSTWRISFRLALPPDPLARERPDSAAQIRVLGRPLLVRDIQRDQAAAARKVALAARTVTRANNTLNRLAQRFEAVRRVIADPRAARAPPRAHIGPQTAHRPRRRAPPRQRPRAAPPSRLCRPRFDWRQTASPRVVRGLGFELSALRPTRAPDAAQRRSGVHPSTA